MEDDTIPRTSGSKVQKQFFFSSKTSTLKFQSILKSSSLVAGGF